MWQCFWLRGGEDTEGGCPAPHSQCPTGDRDAIYTPSDSISALQNCCTKSLGRAQAGSPWVTPQLGWAESAPVLEKVCSTALSYTFTWKQLSCRYCSAVWVVMAVFLLLRLLVSSSIFLTGEFYYELEYSECYETLVLEALSNHHHIYKDKLKHCPNWWLSFSLVSLLCSSHAGSLCLEQGWMKRTCLLDASSVPDKISCDRENRR